MKTMWAPWRIEYILDNDQKGKGCVFCKALSEDDNLTLHKGNLTTVIMNKFPYNNGHLLVSPVKHTSSLSELESNEMLSLLSMVEKSIQILKKVMKPDGFNVGLNLGRVAGAGIEEHIHFHIVPRWFGDVNALSVFADIRVIPEHIKATYNNLKGHFDNLNEKGELK
ncbi:MAG: HIT domain-containing protein [Desulfobacterales bacterium]|nr:HIT domain-containing protein [Desulfobacterales bacterium]